MDSSKNLTMVSIGLIYVNKAWIWFSKENLSQWQKCIWLGPDINWKETIVSEKINAKTRLKQSDTLRLSLININLYRTMFFNIALEKVMSIVEKNKVGIHTCKTTLGWSETSGKK